MTKRSLFYLPIIVLLFSVFACENGTSEPILSPDLKEAITYCAKELRAQKVVTEKVYEQGQPSTLEITFENCEQLTFDDTDFDRLHEDILIEILMRTNTPEELPEKLKITVAEGFDYWIMSHTKENSLSYNNGYLQGLHQYYHSDSYRAENKISTFLESGDLAKAQAYADSLLRQGVLQELAYQSRAIVSYETGDTLNGIREFKKALKMAPENAQNYKNLAILYGEINRPWQAQAYIDSALSIDSSNAELFYYRGLFLLQQGDTASACEDFAMAKEGGVESEVPHFLYCDW